jgi:gamma-glutamyltranspeptidase/glutathione hydrolase
VQGEANAIAPGKAPLSSMSPTIVTKDGKVVMVVGTPGGSRIITATLLTMLNVIDYGMNIRKRWTRHVSTSNGCRRKPTSKPSRPARIRRRSSKAGATSCRAAGRQPHRGDSGRRAVLGGKPVGKNRFYGANDPRRNTGLSLGY